MALLVVLSRGLISWLRGRETKLGIGSSLLRLLQRALWCFFPRLAESPARHTHIYNSTQSAVWSFWSGRESEETPFACFCRRRFLFFCFCYWATYVIRPKIALIHLFQKWGNIIAYRSEGTAKSVITFELHNRKDSKLKVLYKVSVGFFSFRRYVVTFFSVNFLLYTSIFQRKLCSLEWKLKISLTNRNVNFDGIRCNLCSICEFICFRFFSRVLKVLEVVAPFKHFSKLKDFVAMKLPAGFPVRIGLSIFSLI